MKKKSKYPSKTSMNLYYKPDRTTKPSTVALYVLFAVTILLGLSKWMVYDLWMEKETAERELAAAQDELTGVMIQLKDYDEVKERYIRYSATDDERAIVDRMEVLALLEEVNGWGRGMRNITIRGEEVKTQLDNVTLSQVAEIVRQLETSPIVAGTMVSTASSTGGAGNDGELVTANITIKLQKPAETEAAG